MKRYNNIFVKIIELDNISFAILKVSKSKRGRNEVKKYLILPFIMLLK